MAKDAPGAPEEQREQRDDTERSVRCARCGHALTTEKQRIAMHGRHAHTFMNPSGIIFDVRCYSDVPGAACEGVPESLTSWFPGTAWIYAHCVQCKGHIGWRYVRVDDPDPGRVFFGLIADTLA